MDWHRRTGVILAIGCGLFAAEARAEQPLLGSDKSVAEARAEEPLVGVDEHVQAITQALQGAKLAEAMKLGEAAVAANPNDAAAHQMYGLALLEAARWPEGIEQLEKSLQLNPDNRDVAVRLGYLHWELEGSARARELAAQALKQWPDDQLVSDLDFTLKTDERIRSGNRNTYEPDSVHRFVDSFCAQIGAGAFGQAVVDHAEPGVLAAIMGKARLSGSEAERKRKLAGKLEIAWGKVLSDQRDKYFGFEVAPAVEDRPGGAKGVSVNVLAKRWVMKSDLDSIRNFLRHPDQPGLVAPEVRRVLEGLDPDDRKRYVDTVGSRASMEFIHVDFTVVDKGQGWKVQEVVVDNRMSLSNVGGWINLMDRDDSSDSVGTGMPEGLAKYGLIAVVIMLISFVVRKFAERSKRDRGDDGGRFGGNRPMGR